MRRFLLAAAMLGTASGAYAADLPDFLRGSFSSGPAVPNRTWDGWYAGGQVGYSSTENDFSKSLVGLTNYIYRNSVLEDPTSKLAALGKTSGQGVGFGAFVGRNYQWEDIVFGFEANYNYFDSLQTSNSSFIGPLQYSFPPGQFTPANDTPTFTVTLNGNASAQIKDAITLRSRVGWAAGDFLPYVFGGLAVGRMDVQRTVTSVTTRQDSITSTDANGNVTTVLVPTNPPGPAVVAAQSLTMTQERTDDFAVGWTAGVGLEYLFCGHFLLRGEWEHIKFISVMNTSVTMNNVRAGIGYKF